MHRPSRALGLAAALVAMTTLAQQQPPPPGSGSLFPPPPDSQGGSLASPTNPPLTSGSDSSIMDFSSDGAVDGGAWTTMPPVDTGSWPIDWTWNHSSSSSSSSYDDIENDAGVEVLWPDIDGTVDRIRRHKYMFDATKGFSVDTTKVDEGVPLGRCGAYPYCVHLVFESDYGAMTPFDAFVLDRYESSMGPMAIEGGEWAGGAVPLVLGRFPEDTPDWFKKNNWGDVFNWNDTRRTTWSLHPTTDATSEIDLTLSLKQLYTFLPGYKGDTTSDGPFYSADLTDQIIIRVNAQVASPFAGASASLPIVVHHLGSKLFDVKLTTSLLYEGNGVTGGNEIVLTFKLSRRRYGAMLPWFPAKPAEECVPCTDSLELPEAFNDCLDHQLAKQHLVFEDLLSFNNDRTSFDVEPFAEMCFEAITNGEWTNSTQGSAPLSAWNGSHWDEQIASSNVTMDKWELLRQTDAALRCWAETQCPIGGSTFKSDAQVVVLKHAPAVTTIRFNKPGYSFWLLLGLENAKENEMITTQVFTNDTAPEDLAAAIAGAFPNADELRLDIEVRKSDNLKEIADIERINQELMDKYNQAHQWSSTTGSDGSGTHDAGDSTSSGSSLSAPAQPQMPTLTQVPPVTYMIEILSHNITVVPHIKSVYFNDATDVSNWSEDNSLVFEVAPLDVNKFQYVPPPTHVDLDWSPEPEWMAHVRERLPSFKPGDACGDCMEYYKACLFDEDCAFGVNYFLADAMAESHLGNKSVEYASDDAAVSHARYFVDGSWALQKAKTFFPEGGYKRAMDLFNCWAARPCNVDEEEKWLNTTSGAWQPAPPTVITITRSTVVMTVDVGETVTIIDANMTYTFAATGNDDAVYSLLIDSVFKEYELVKHLTVGSHPIEWNADDSVRRLQYKIEWVYPVAKFPVFSTEHATSSVMYSPWRMEIETHRANVDATSGDSPETVLEWPRLSSWLDVFSYVPYGHHETNDGPKPPAQGPPRQAPSTSVCRMCLGWVTDCIYEPTCLTGMRTWLPTVLPPADAAVLGADGIFRSSINTDPLNTVPFGGTFARLLSCLGDYGCAVDYTQPHDNTSAPWTPSRVSMKMTRTVDIAPGDSLRLQFDHLNSDDFDGSLTAFFEAMYGHSRSVVTFTQEWVDTVAMTRYEFTSSTAVLDALQIYNTAGSIDAWKWKYSGYFLAHDPTQPTWRNLLSWYGMGTPTDTPLTNCATCQPALQTCFDDNECWRSVQQDVLPVLQGSMEVKTMLDDDEMVYLANVGALLREILAGSTSSFSTASSREHFTAFLQCIAATKCDLDSMESAADPPATSYIPTSLELTPASINLYVYVDTSVWFNFNGETHTFHETGSGKTDSILNFFTGVFGVSKPSMLPLTVELTRNKEGFNYLVSFKDTYLGRLPDVGISATGTVTGIMPSTGVTPWELKFRAVGRVPQWDRLLSLLSTSSTPPSPSPSPSVPPMQCTDGESFKQLCYSDVACLNLLTTSAIPTLDTMLRNTQPGYRGDLNLFELDGVGALAWGVLPSANGNKFAISRLMNLIRESMLCPFQNGQLVFEDARVVFSRPANGPLHVTYDNSEYQFNDQDPASGGVNGFQQFLYNTFVIDRPVEGFGGPVLYQWENADGQIHYNVEFRRTYEVPPPHFFWMDGGSTTQLDSTDSPWRVTFRSATVDMYQVFAPWLSWLATPPV